MIDRRRFLQCLAAATAGPMSLHGCVADSVRRGDLQYDRNRILSLRDGLSYDIVSTAGQKMSDGFVVPGAHDGMAAFAGQNGRIILVCNHELRPLRSEISAFGEYGSRLSKNTPDRFYDSGNGRTPGTGGTTTSVYDPATHTTERQHLSLGGTELNCSGGPTPWGSWLSCEECFESPGTSRSERLRVYREKRHGYVFEVPADETGLVDAKPIKAMGRFAHEACAVDEKTGIVYLTEDQHYSLFYRYIPNVPGQLLKGGRLQALALVGRPSHLTHNWNEHDTALNSTMATEWIDLENADSDKNDLRNRGAASGAARFARGEGITATGTSFAFACTTGGPARLGQVFEYTPSIHEGRDEEVDAPGHLELIAESDENSLLWNPDNLTIAPWGDLIVCEDAALHCGVIGIRPNGEQYHIADNVYSDSELSGVCFSPDGLTMFVNIQYPGMTVAITGDWPT